MGESDTNPAARVGGYVLAGGLSSRMGQDKALLELGGRPLVAHAVAKLRRVLGQANILAGARPGNPALRGFGPLVWDDHPGCGPLSGVEAALQHSACDWSVILPVDVPFLPAALLEWWVQEVTAKPDGGCFVSMFRAGGRVQPSVLLVHRSVAPIVTLALECGEYKLLHVLEEAARQLARQDGEGLDSAPYVIAADELFSELSMAGEAGALGAMAEAQRRAQGLWFANLNTPQELAEAERHTDALDATD